MYVLFKGVFILFWSDEINNGVTYVDNEYAFLPILRNKGVENKDFEMFYFTFFEENLKIVKKKTKIKNVFFWRC